MTVGVITRAFLSSRRAGPLWRHDTPASSVSQKSNWEFVPLLEAKDGVVRVANDNHVTGGASLPPLVHPLIIDMTEVNVRQERPEDRALRRPLLRLDQVSIFEHACRQPFCDQPNNSPAANPMFDETDQRILVNLVEQHPELVLRRSIPRLRPSL